MLSRMVVMVGLVEVVVLVPRRLVVWSARVRHLRQVPKHVGLLRIRQIPERRRTRRRDERVRPPPRRTPGGFWWVVVRLRAAALHAHHLLIVGVERMHVLVRINPRCSTNNIEWDEPGRPGHRGATEVVEASEAPADSGWRSEVFSRMMRPSWSPRVVMMLPAGPGYWTDKYRPACLPPFIHLLLLLLLKRARVQIIYGETSAVVIRRLALPPVLLARASLLHGSYVLYRGRDARRESSDRRMVLVSSGAQQHGGEGSSVKTKKRSHVCRFVRQGGCSPARALLWRSGEENWGTGDAKNDTGCGGGAGVELSVKRLLVILAPSLCSPTHVSTHTPTPSSGTRKGRERKRGKGKPYQATKALFKSRESTGNLPARAGFSPYPLFVNQDTRISHRAAPVKGRWLRSPSTAGEKAEKQLDP